jgi:hypothetical protein
MHGAHRLYLLLENIGLKMVEKRPKYIHIYIYIYIYIYWGADDCMLLLFSTE